MPSNKHTALIVDDEEDLCLLMQMTLHKMNINSATAYNLEEARKHLKSHSFDFCLTDLNLPDGSGLSLVEHISEHHPNMPVAVITAHGNMDIAIDALKIGAFDFVNKPLELPRLRQMIENALKVQPIETNEPEQAEDASTQALLGESAVMNQLRSTIKKLARSQAPVFLHGQSGTGKEVVAGLIHQLGPRATGSFVPVNCGAIPSELMESEFFGHKKGSFTGAVSDKQGLFQMAHNGTLFLDEVADLPLNMQVKLLRAIQEKKVRPIGSQQETPVDIRLLSATHKNLAELVKQGKFRQDLYYRINVIELTLPSLNERGDDILILAEHFIQQISMDWHDSEPPVLSRQAKMALLSHHYQGNVRELRNILERALTLCDSVEILPEHLQLSDPSDTMPELTEFIELNNQTGTHEVVLQKSQSLSDRSYKDISLTSFPAVVPTMDSNITGQFPVSKTQMGVANLPSDGLEGYLQAEEKRLMLEALEICKWNRTKAAEKLGMSFRSFRYRMKKLGISDDTE